MKKKILILSLLFGLNINLFACGCLDEPAAKAGAQEIIESYKQEDEKLAEEFEKLLKKEQKSFKLETQNVINTKKILFNHPDIIAILKKIKSTYIKIENFLYNSNKESNDLE